ncbi:MAG: T9SS type A sorting domain-containing protein [Bacteroidota bacterium]
MKHDLLVLLLLLFGCSTVVAQTSEEEEEKENKGLLLKMVEDRSFSNSGSTATNSSFDEMKSHNQISGPEKLLTANWTYVDASNNPSADIGRTTSIALDTINAGRFYVCSNNSGVWLTNNNGVSYTAITENLPTQSVSTLVINPSNTNELYLATGTNNFDMPKNSLGIYKSTDGGGNWSATGLVFTASQEIAIRDLIINPKNHLSLLAATTDGLYRTYDAGVSWTRILNESVNSVRFHPTDTNIFYTIGMNYYRFENNSWLTTSSGLHNQFTYYHDFYLRTTAASPNVVYVLTGGLVPFNGQFAPRMYLHKSTDTGYSFTLIDSLTTEFRSVFDAAQGTEDKFVAGFRATFKKQSLGAAFQPMTDYWTMHYDQRSFYFDPRNDNTIYACNDGGLYRSTDAGVTFQNISANMELAHLFCLSNSKTTDYKILAGTLDVSPFMLGSNGIIQSYPDLVEAFNASMSPVNEDVYYIEHQYPYSYFTQNDWNTHYSTSTIFFNGFNSNWQGFQYDVCDESVSYKVHTNQLFKSTDYGHNYTELGTTPYQFQGAYSQMQGVHVSRSNDQYIYVYYKDSVYVSTNGGATLVNKTLGLPVDQARITHLITDPVDEEKVWVSFSGYSAGNKVFYSTNAGQTWTNVSAGMPNVPVNALVAQIGVPGAVYAAVDGGVFYRDNTFSSWQDYMTGLPKVIVTSLETQEEYGKLRISTFGRGVWESDFYEPIPAAFVVPPIVRFEADVVKPCPDEQITFTNTSCGTPDSIRWLFPGATPVTSTVSSPVVSYAAAGTYTVSLIVYSTGNLPDTLERTAYIEVVDPLPLPFYEPIAVGVQGNLPAGWSTTDENGDHLGWQEGWWDLGVDGSPDDFIFYDNYNINLNGLEEQLFLPLLDFSTTANPKLYFYRAYRVRTAANTDTLKVYAKACGADRDLLYVKGGQQLATVAGIDINPFEPAQPSYWVRDSVDLAAYSGQSGVTISFANRGNYGQYLYLDDFRIQGQNVAGLEGTTAPMVQIFPNPVNDMMFVRSDKLLFDELVVTDVLGRLVTHVKPTGYLTGIDVSNWAQGAYFIAINEVIFKIEKH